MQFDDGNEYAWLSVHEDIFNTFMRYHPDKRIFLQEMQADNLSWFQMGRFFFLQAMV